MNDDEITSEHTGARIGELLEDIESLRLEMGRARDVRVPMHILDAAPREVFYHARTVHRKADQLCVELGEASAAPPDADSPGRARPADVLRVLDAAGERLSRARAALKLEHDTVIPFVPTAPRRREVGKKASDVLTGCLLASRQLNAMLAQAYTSRQGSEQLRCALALTDSLLAFHGAKLLGPPPLERRKFPRDVFEVLWHACDSLHHILEDSGLSAFDLRRGYVGEDPSDVYDLSSVIVSELEHIASFLPPSAPPKPTAEAPSPVLPSHNFQHARRLDAGLKALRAAVRARPTWLSRTAHA